MGYINELIERLPKLGLVDARMVMQDHYESRYGIFNHLENKERPLASVAMLPSENYTERSRLYDAFEDYADHGYKDIWGLSITEFLGLPAYQVKLLRKITNEVIARKESVLDSAEAAVRNNR